MTVKIYKPLLALKSEIVRFWNCKLAMYCILSRFKAGILITTYIVKTHPYVIFINVATAAEVKE
jgi:hypothetical protein